MRDRTSAMAVSVAVFVAALVIGMVIYAVPALPYVANEDACTDGSTPRAGANVKSRGSWWPVGVECLWRVPGRSEALVQFKGPPDELRWVALGVVLLGTGGLLGGIALGVRDLRRPAS